MRRKGNYLFVVVWFVCFFQTALLPSVSWSASNQSITPILSLLLSNKDSLGSKDCAGVAGGTAYLDNCGICVGGNTGKSPCVSITRFPDTGQTGSYTTTFGEDSDYTINPPSYKDNGNGTVTDNVTGLMWQQHTVDGIYSWYQAAGVYEATYNPTTQNVCAAEITGGHSDWRLPTKKELMGIVDYGVDHPAINSKFGAQLANYWSSTTYALNSYSAWIVDFNSGYVHDGFKSWDGLCVRCVRGGQ